VNDSIDARFADRVTHGMQVNGRIILQSDVDLEINPEGGWSDDV
jgi:hypothetical protein